MVDSILDKLKIYNNDYKFKFDPIKHRYTYDGEYFTPVTQFISRFHEKFDSEFWSKSKAEELGKTKEEVLEEWKVLSDRGNEIGKKTHSWIENYFLKVYQELPIDIEIVDRINKFNIAYSKFLYKLSPITFEQMVFSKKWKIAGTIDSIFSYKDKIIIIDYKTNKDFTDDDHYKSRFQKLLPPFENYNKNNFNEYSIQVSLYRLILKEIGINIQGCYLLHIGPENEAKMYTAIDFTKILEEYLDSLK